jgi:microcystin-dependent protein
MSNVSINNLSVRGKSTLNGDVSMNGIVTNSTSITLTNQLTTKSYVDSILPTGTIIMHASLVNPPTGGNGYYLCDGSLKNTTTDSALFAVIQYTYGGSGSGFILPNLLARFPVGPTTSGAMTYFNVISGGISSGTVTLTETNLPPHVHSAISTSSSSSSTSQSFVTGFSPIGEFDGGGNADAFNVFNTATFKPTVTTTTTTTIGNGPGTSTPFSITPPYTVIAFYIKR